MRAPRVVMPSPLFDDYLCFSEDIQYLSIQEFIPEMGVEAPTTAGLSGCHRLNISSLCADGLDRLPDSFRDKFRAIAGADAG